MGWMAMLATSLFGAPAAVTVEPVVDWQLAEGHDGAALYAQHCASCHSADLSGSTWGPSLPSRPETNARAALVGHGYMEPVLTDIGQAAAIATYVHISRLSAAMASETARLEYRAPPRHRTH